MARRNNWQNVGQRNLMRHAGWEAHDGSSSSPLPLDPSRTSNRWRPRPSKASLRAKAEKAFKEWEGRQENRTTPASDDEAPPW